jgi:hypothetical protein
MIKKLIGGLVGGAAVLLLAAQLVPYGRDHSNPRVVAEPTWDSARTRELARRACFDCHSNETRWPWYSHVAPVSWLIQRDVTEGWRVVNFSEWTRPSEEAAESSETVREGSMPPRTYLLTHAGVLSDRERDDLSRGLALTLWTGPDDGEDRD